MKRRPLDFLSRDPIAHRGYFDNSGAFPENSLGAILAAVDAGFASEMDVMLSADGEVMVFHDDSLERMCGRSGDFSNFTSADLKKMRLRGSDECIPTLSEVLTKVEGRRPLIIELKSFNRAGILTDGQLEARVASLLAHYRGPVGVKSFNPFSVTEMLRLRTDADNWVVGFISCDHSKDPDFAFMTPQQVRALSQLVEGQAPACEFVSYNINDLDEELSERIRARMPLMVWTVRTQQQYEKARRLADNVVFEWRGVKPV